MKLLHGRLIAILYFEWIVHCLKENTVERIYAYNFYFLENVNKMNFFWPSNYVNILYSLGEHEFVFFSFLRKHFARTKVIF